MEMSQVEFSVETEVQNQADQSRVSVLDDLQLALVGGGIGTVVVG